MNQIFLSTILRGSWVPFPEDRKKKTPQHSPSRYFNWALCQGTLPFGWCVWWKERVLLPTLVIQRAFFLPFCQDMLLFLIFTLFHSSYLQSTRVEFDLPEYSVRRRYQDFDWLRNKLEESQPTHLIPVGSKSLQLGPHFPCTLFPEDVHLFLIP